MPRHPPIRNPARDVDRLRAVTCRFVSPCRRGATLAALALLLASAAAAQEPAPAALPPEIARALARAGVPPENVALLVAPLAPPPGTVSRLPEPVNPSGEANPAPAPAAAVPPRLSWRADAAMNPASVMKLVTTYAGLDLLGPGYFWKTRVFTQGYVRDGVLQGNLLIKGSGDPKLVHERLRELLRAVQDKGVRAVNGDILLDASVFKLPPHDAAAFDDDPLRPYNAGPHGLLVNFKALIFRFVPEGNGRVRIESEPPMAGVEIPTEVAAATGACGNWRTRLAADFSDPNRVSFAGRFPASCGEQSWGVAYADPASHAPRVIEAMWRAGGGQLTGQVRWLDKPATGQPLVTGLSLPLKDVIADINKYSNNVMAQQLFLTLSAAGDGRGGFGESRNALARWWRQRFGLRSAPLVDNGSGLSRSERITAASLVALLQQADAGPNAAAFEQSLSIAGVDGTTRRLAARNPGSEAIGNARLKTGTLRDVTAVAGYVWGRSGQKYAVAGLINHPNAGAARPALDALLEWAVRDGP